MNENKPDPSEDPIDPQTNVGALLAAAERFAECVTITDADLVKLRCLVVPDGMRVESLKPLIDQYRQAPERRRGTAVLTTLASFIDHVNRFKDKNSAVFVATGTKMRAQLVAVYDYHPIGGDTSVARFGEHRAQYDFPLSPEWSAWASKDGQWLTQDDFANFLEERVMDVIDPASAQDMAREFATSLQLRLAGPAEILGLSRGLSLRVDQVFKSSKNLSSGEGQLVYEEKHTDDTGGPLSVPGGFVLGIPVMAMGTPYEIPVRLRYKPADGKVRWQYSLFRSDRVWDHVVKETAEEVEAATDIAVIFGAPER